MGPVSPANVTERLFRLVGVHGSWNREPPRAPEVAFFPWQDGALGNQQTLVGGFQAPDGSRWGRPVAAVVGPDNAVYVTDSSGVWEISVGPDTDEQYWSQVDRLAGGRANPVLPG